MDAKVSVKQTNPNWAKEMADRVAGLSGKAVAAGFPQGSKAASTTYDNGMSVLDVAVINQFGATINHPGGTPYKREMKNSGVSWMGSAEHQVRFVKKTSKGADRLPVTKAHVIRIPARPFMDNAVIRLQEDKDEVGAEIARKVINGEIRSDTALKQVRLFAENAIRQAITDDSYVPNAPSTKRKKKSDKPLIDTGKMRQSVTSQVRDTGSI